MTLCVSVSGIRGIVGESLTATVVSRWAAAFGAWLPAGPVVVGRDSRPSGPMVRDAAVAALASTGHDVLDIGIATTPTTEMVVQESEAAGGIIITASHNPQQWNALKFLEGRGLFLSAAQNAEVRACFDTQTGHVGWDRLGRVAGRDGAEQQHLDAILAQPWLDRGTIAARGLHAVVDAVEGAAGAIAPRLLAALGVACTPLHCGRTGRFPHDPEPTPAHLAELSVAVRDGGADLGFALDPDGDRLALVGPGGALLSEELTLALAIDFLLARTPGPVAVNLSTTCLIDVVAARHGAAVWRTPVGEANVVQAMLERGCVIGGEGNGGVIYPALHPGRDGLVGIAMILQLLADRGSSLADLVAALPPVAMVKDKFAAADLPAGEALQMVLRSLGPGTIDERDGMKWTGEGAWVHVRSSNTEPLVRVIAEAASVGAARELIAKVRNAGVRA